MPLVGNTHRIKTSSRAMLGSISPELAASLFLVAMIVLASGLVGGVYLLLRHEPTPEETSPKKIVMSNVK